MVVRIVGHERGRGRRPARAGAFRDRRPRSTTPRRRPSRHPGERRHEHPHRAGDAAASSRASPAARASSTAGRCRRTARGSSPAMTPGQGRPDRARRHGPGLRHGRRGGPRDRREHVLHLRPGRRRAGRGHGGGRRRHRDDLLHHRGDPGARHDPGGRDGPAGRRAADRAELPRRHVAGLGQGRDHPGLDPSRGPGRRRQPLRAR